MSVTYRYYAVLCESATPSSSMAHEELWSGLHDTYGKAEAEAVTAVESGIVESAHVCKRLFRD